MARAVASGKTMSCSFQVYGRVQGVFFRKCTKDKATELDISGWCRNTEKGTVQGEIEGNLEKMALMKEWLEKTGSPGSTIDNVQFTKITIETMKPRKYEGFEIRD